ncbi:hypothetical protein GH714_025023 [Hevea brasiliensis]|uniref:Bulb-type lectin domain-containing protein n=1 Tax=Hevea brasiliensis TaxID=3981 RepID=A0A6A6M3D2_HEVBR|nr:hypothetical protein GH714_025023 [Hevea brasiliensis]
MRSPSRRPSVSDSSLKEGSYLSVKDVLESPTGVFSAGFYPVGDNAYCFAIWFTEPSCSRDDCTIVWMANRDFPVNGIRSKLWLQKTGNLVLTDAADYGVRLQRRLTIDFDGYQVKNANDWSSGCESKFYISCDNDTDQFRFIRLPHVEFYGHDYGVYPGYTLEMCRKLCLSLCGCKGFQHSFDGQFYLKVPKTRLFSDKEHFSGLGLNCSTELHRPLNRVYQKSSQNEKLRLTLWFAYARSSGDNWILLVWCFLFSSEKDLNEASQGYHHPAITGFKRFTYSELKKATGNFSVEIGRGAGGTVYKGTLPDNRLPQSNGLILLTKDKLNS